MKTTKRKDPGVRFIGLDVGDRFSHYCVREKSNKIVKKDRTPSTEAGLRRAFESMKGCRLLMEVGTHSPWMQRVLRTLGIDARVCEARTAAEANRYGRKTDSRDAELLSELLRTNSSLVKLIEHRSAEEQAIWCQIEGRNALVEARTKLINSARSMVKTSGSRLSSCSSSSFNSKTWFEVPKELHPALSPIYDQILSLTKSIDEYGIKIEKATKASHPEDMENLTAIPGVGNLTAAAFLLALGKPRRFARARDVGAYFGLVPKKRASGDVDPQLGISKRGNGVVRRLLVSAGQYILGPFNKTDTDIARFGMSIQGKGSDSRRKRRAVVAVARKLAVVMAAMVMNKTRYRPLLPKEEAVPA
jgi:transposase